MIHRGILAWLRLLAEASFENVTAPLPPDKRAWARGWQHRGGRYPRYAHRNGERTETSHKKNQGRIRRCSPNFSDSPAERQRSLNSASHLLNARAKLHRSMCHFLAACPEGNGSDDCCENDSAFHWYLRCLFRAGSLNALPYQQPADLRRASSARLPHGGKPPTQQRPRGPKSRVRS